MVLSWMAGVGIQWLDGVAAHGARRWSANTPVLSSAAAALGHDALHAPGAGVR